MRGDPKTKQPVAAPASAADDSSSAARYQPAAGVAVGACGIAPHAHSEPELGVSYSGESDVSDSEKPLEASRSPAVPRPFKEVPNARNRDIRHILFGSDDEFGDEMDYPSPRSTRAPTHERVDDGASRLHTDNRAPAKLPLRSVMS